MVLTMIFVARGFLAAATAILLCAAVLFAARLIEPSKNWFGCDWPLGNVNNLQP